MNDRFNDRFKFRIWDEERRSMYYPQDLENDYVEIDCNGELLGYETYGLWVGGVNCIPMQCTGLKDKNGTLIYEGDIVKFGEEIYKVAYRTEWARFVIQSSTSSTNIQTINTVETPARFMKVIGNIYENPELLKGGKNEI